MHGSMGQDDAMARRSFDEAWDHMAVGFRRSLELAHVTLRAGGLAVGAVVTDARGAVIAEGRNRA